MKGGEPSVLQPPPDITKGGHPPWTPLYITLLIYRMLVYLVRVLI